MEKKGARIIIKEEYCIGCRLCEVYCVTRHSESKEIIKTYRSMKGKPISCIVFEDKGSVSFAIQCRHCDDAPCVEACLTGAMHLDEDTGRVVHDKEKCVGCWMCLMVCRLGVVRRDSNCARVASKCDLCIDAGFPECVKNCPNEAIYLSDTEKAEDDRHG